MGTRSKSKAAAGLLSALLLLALAVGLLAGLRPLYARAQEQGVLFYYYDPFVENIQTANHTLYWRAREQWEGKEFEPSELLLSDANAAVYAAREAGEDFVLGYTGAAGDESGGTNASYGGLDVYAPDAISALDAFNASVKAHADELAGSWQRLVLTHLAEKAHIGPLLGGRRNGQNIHQHGSRAWRLSFGRPRQKRLRRRPVALCAGAPLRRAGQYVLCSLLSGRGGPAGLFRFYLEHGYAGLRHRRHTPAS